MSAESEVKKPSDSSYYAWSRGINESAETMEKLGVNDFSPRPIEGRETAAPAAPASGSAWNAGGTWEERDISKSAVAGLRESLCALQVPVGEHVAKVTKVDKLEGAVRLLFVRGRPRLGFEFDHPKLSWAVLPSAGGDELGKGTITFEEIADDCGGDYEFEVKCSGSSQPAQEARSALRQASEPVAACINAWRDRTLAEAVSNRASA